MIPCLSIPCLGRTELGLLVPICATLSGICVLRLSDLQWELLFCIWAVFVVRGSSLRPLHAAEAIVSSMFPFLFVGPHVSSPGRFERLRVALYFYFSNLLFELFHES